jgi:hypothetical protein
MLTAVQSYCFVACVLLFDVLNLVMRLFLCRYPLSCSELFWLSSRLVPLPYEMILAMLSALLWSILLQLHFLLSTLLWLLLI